MTTPADSAAGVTRDPNPSPTVRRPADETLAAQLRVELDDLRAVVDLEVDRALFGITPSQYLQRVAELERRRAEPRWVHGRDEWGIGLPSLPHPPQPKPWALLDPAAPLHQPNRGASHG